MQTVHERIGYIDGWRAIAVAIVVYVHIAGNFFPKDVSSVIAPISGTLGVYIFFLISGYVIMRLLVVEKENTGNIDIKIFYTRRAIRIFPPLLAYSLFLFLLYPENNYIYFGFIRSIFFSCNINLFSSYGCGWLYGHTWSLAFEEQFYLLLPLLLLSGKRNSIMLLIVSFIFISPAIWPVNFVGRIGFFQIISLLLLGCAIAKWNNLFNSILHILPRIIIVLSAIFSIWWFTLGISNIRMHTGFLLPFAIAMSVFGLPAKFYYFKIFLETNIVRGIGLISYSIYIWQQYFTRAEAGEGLSDAIFAIFCILIISSLSYFTIERYSRSVARRLRS